MSNSHQKQFARPDDEKETGKSAETRLLERNGNHFGQSDILLSDYSIMHGFRQNCPPTASGSELFKVESIPNSCKELYVKSYLMGFAEKLLKS